MDTVRLPHGILIAIEGIDGAGKTTQANRLAERLRAGGLDVVQTKEPTNGPFGQKLRASSVEGRLSPDEELALFLADRAEHVERLIRPSLQAGKVVIVDRYYFSTVAYQGARGTKAIDELLRMNEAFAPEPDLLFVLDVPAPVGIERIRARGDTANLFEKLDDLVLSQRIFAALDKPYLRRLDGMASIEDVGAEMLQLFDEGPLRDRLCARQAPRCEPAYCTLAQAGSCAWWSTRLATPRIPAGIADVLATPDLSDAERIRRIVEAARR
jgi:dTMP kinase